MTLLSQRLLALYLVSLLALAALGAHNQLRYKHHDSLLTQKQVLEARLSTLRRETNGITGALAVRNWALAQGMVPAPEALNHRHVSARPAPETPLPQGKLEMYTLWR